MASKETSACRYDMLSLPQVDLETHQGFTGGLERNGTNGRTAVYYATSTLELIFHDVTKMPTDPSDIKQLKKVSEHLSIMTWELSLFKETTYWK